MSNIISDIATLVKAGFTMADIKEVIAASNGTNEASTPTVDQKPIINDPEPSKEESNEPDYKALYEKASKDLKDLQDSNTKENIEPEPLKIDEIIKSVKSSIC